MLADGHTSSSKNVVSSAFFFDNVIPFASWTSLAVTQESISFLEISIFFLSSTKPFMVLIYVDPRAVSTSCLLKFQVANLLLEQYTQTCFPTTSPTWRRNNFAFFPTVSLENKRKKKLQNLTEFLKYRTTQWRPLITGERMCRINFPSSKARFDVVARRAYKKKSETSFRFTCFEELLATIYRDMCMALEVKSTLAFEFDLRILN